jgi:DNA-binding response OmpR family regulator
VGGAPLAGFNHEFGIEMTSTVVIVDDDVDAANSLAQVLASCGFEVCTAYDGRQAVDLIAAMEPDLVVSDIEMPGVSGLDEVALVRASPLKQPRMVAISGAGSVDMKIKALAAGFDAFLTKPASVPDLLAALQVVP